jgi:signal transduction histidine kinase
MRIAAEERDGRSAKAYAVAYAAAQRLRALKDEAAAAAAEAEKAKAVKAAFVAGLNHELRTPLNAITGFTGLVEEQPDLDEAKRTEYLDHVLSSAGLLLQHIDSIMRAASGQDDGAHEAEQAHGPDTATSGEESRARLLPVLREVLASRVSSIFVSRAEVPDHLPALFIAEDRLRVSLAKVFDLVSPSRSGRQAVGCAARTRPTDPPAVELRIDLLSEGRSLTPEQLRHLARELRAMGVLVEGEQTGNTRSISLFIPVLIERQAA